MLIKDDLLRKRDMYGMRMYLTMQMSLENMYTYTNNDHAKRNHSSGSRHDSGYIDNIYDV